MRYVIYGAGAVGGAIGGLLHHAGAEVILVARGAHLQAIRERGLHLVTPNLDAHLPVPAVAAPAEIAFREDDVVLLTMKSQDTVGALEDLRAVAGSRVPVVCAQNGVSNEREAARRFDRVYGMLMQLPATYLKPGEIVTEGGPAAGVLDTGRFPLGVDEVVEALCADLEAAGFVAARSPAVMRLKYAKLLRNLGNAVPLITGAAGGRPVVHAIRAEADAVYRAAGIDCAPTEEYAARTALCDIVEIPGVPRSGNSTMQSVLRGATSLETDYLNGEITALGVEFGVPTPVNRVVQDLSAEFARTGRTPGSLTADEVLALAAARAASSAAS
ncbi:MAG: ketopantoate reductase family protein [Dehalococcoidia bacterium]